MQFIRKFCNGTVTNPVTYNGKQISRMKKKLGGKAFPAVLQTAERFWSLDKKYLLDCLRIILEQIHIEKT
jgi:hypothetical protein